MSCMVCKVCVVCIVVWMPVEIPASFAINGIASIAQPSAGGQTYSDRHRRILHNTYIQYNPTQSNRMAIAIICPHLVSRGNLALWCSQLQNLRKSIKKNKWTNSTILLSSYLSCCLRVHTYSVYSETIRNISIVNKFKINLFFISF